VPVATMTSKGQVTVPIEIRDSLDLKPGTRIEFVEGSGRAVHLLIHGGSVTRLRGIAPPLGRAVSVQEIKRSASDEAVEAAGFGLDSDTGR